MIMGCRALHVLVFGRCTAGASSHLVHGNAKLRQADVHTDGHLELLTACAAALTPFYLH